MNSSEFGDLVLVPFPFSEQSTTKRRPAVVVSSDRYHRERPDLVILAVAKWKEAGLLRPSVLEPVLATSQQEPAPGRGEPGSTRPRRLPRSAR